MAHFHQPPNTDHLAAVRAQDGDTYWVFLYDLRNKHLMSGASVMTFGGAAELQSLFCEDPALEMLILDLAAANVGFTIAGDHAPLKPADFKVRHGVSPKVLFDRTVNRSKLPLHPWRTKVEDSINEHYEFADEDP